MLAVLLERPVALEDSRSYSVVPLPSHTSLGPLTSAAEAERQGVTELMGPLLAAALEVLLAAALVLPTRRSPALL